jgi:hypothetical protein
LYIAAVLRRLGVRVAIAVVLIGLAIGGYLLWIPVHRPDPHKVATLAVTSPVIRLRGHPKTSSVDPTALSISAVKAAAIATPGETAAYSVSWRGFAPVTAGSVELIAVPTVRSARSAQREILAAELSNTSLTESGYGFGRTTSVHGIPGAKGAYYLKGTTPTVTTSTPRVTVVIFRAGRTIVDVRVDAKGADATATARALASEQYRHLELVGTDPVLAQASFPLIASLVYALVALGVLAIAEVTPWLVSAEQERRREARVAAERSARVARGNKVVKRHASRGYAARVETGGRARRR